jgi:hypothetical protein
MKKFLTILVLATALMVSASAVSAEGGKPPVQESIELDA